VPSSALCYPLLGSGSVPTVNYVTVSLHATQARQYRATLRAGGFDGLTSDTRALSLRLDLHASTSDCASDTYNLDADTGTCEYVCAFSAYADAPDLASIDTNCDGIDGTAALAVFVASNGNSNSYR